MNITKRKKKQRNITRELDSILSYDSDKQKLEFEEMVINADTMQVIQELMNNNDKIKTQSDLAKILGISEAMISKLFSGNKYFNVNFLAKIQRVFNMRFKIIDGKRIPTSKFIILQPYKKQDCEAKLPILTSNSSESTNIIYNSHLKN